MGNQQFTGSGLYFNDAETAIQIHWDWGWTLQDIVVDNCDTGITIVGGAGGVSYRACVLCNNHVCIIC
jgi:hypothetical protein